MSDNPKHDFASLNPDTIMDAVEDIGLQCDARIFALNSYENRVYQIGIEDQAPLIGKFYRPNRWTNEQILEEHVFTEALAELEIPVVAPLRFNHQSLHSHHGFRYALYPRKGGRTPDLDNPEHLEWLGRFIGRIHALGSQQTFKYRPTIDIQSYVYESRDYLLQHNFIPDYLQDAYNSLMADLSKLIEERLGNVNFNTLRLHGDCHPGNILWTDDGPHFVDFDDSRSGPAIQDLWMLISGNMEEQRQLLDKLLDGYFQFYDFNPAEIRLIEPLRSMRIIFYAAWLARRWQDPSFPLNFPWFNTPAYWEEHILSLREQFSLLQDNEQIRL